MRTIAIVLGDNDFGNTFRPLLEGLKAVLKYHEPYHLEKKDIEVIIRHSIIAYYVAYQYRFDLKPKFDISDTQQYLSGVRILFDEEAEADIATADHDGGAWYLEIQSGVVCGY